MKKFICSLLAVTALAPAAVYADTNVFFENRLVEYSDQTPVIINSRTYIPIRDVFEEMGYTVDWNAELKTVEISNDYYTVVLYTKTNGMFSTNTAMEPAYSGLENEIQLINGRTMLPLREILETIGYSLDWDAETKSTYISDKNDYSYLEKNKMTINALINGTELYSYNRESLTADEADYVSKLIKVLDTDPSALFGGLTPENTDSRIQLVESKKAGLSALGCPDSLKALDQSAARLLSSLESDIHTLSAVNAANGGEEGAGLTPQLTMRLAADKRTYDTFAAFAESQ